MTRKSYSTGRVFIGRLPKGADLIEAITVIANEEEIRTATVQVYGQLNRLSLTLFDPETKMQQTVEYDGGHGIASLSGTISQFKRRSLARLSGVFTSADGTLVGGTVALGTSTYACEVVITEIEGIVLSRDFDMETGLPLWKSLPLVQDNQ
jgi:predicted DNA-binding protein with PD1-like motif